MGWDGTGLDWSWNWLTTRAPLGGAKKTFGNCICVVLLSTVKLPKNAKWQTQLKSSALFQYYIISKHTFSQLQQQEIFLNSTKNQIPNNKLSKIAFCYHPRLSHNANCPTKIPPSFAHTHCQTAPRRHPKLPQVQNSLLIFPSKITPHTKFLLWEKSYH